MVPLSLLLLCGMRKINVEAPAAEEWYAALFSGTSQTLSAICRLFQPRMTLQTTGVVFCRARTQLTFVRSKQTREERQSARDARSTVIADQCTGSDVCSSYATFCFVQHFFNRALFTFLDRSASITLPFPFFLILFWLPKNFVES